MATTRVFTIIGTNADGTAIVTDNGNVTCNKGDTIQWNISPRTEISGICIEKTGGSNVFSSGPAKLASSNNWQGTISQTAGGLEENYKICATPCGSDNPICHDPQITVNR